MKIRLCLPLPARPGLVIPNRILWVGVRGPTCASSLPLPPPFTLICKYTLSPLTPSPILLTPPALTLILTEAPLNEINIIL